MQQHPAFITPAMMTSGPGKVRTVIAYTPIQVGDEIKSIRLSNDGKPLFERVVAINEVRKSKGSFPNHERPDYYEVVVK